MTPREKVIVGYHLDDGQCCGEYEREFEYPSEQDEALAFALEQAHQVGHYCLNSVTINFEEAK